MSNLYIYASARSLSLTRKLLSEPQLDRLFGAKSKEEIFKVLQDTFLASYLSGKPEDKIEDGISGALFEARKLALSFAPEPELLHPYFSRFDFYNLKILIKSKKVGVAPSEVKNSLIPLGNVAPQKLQELFEGNSLGKISLEFSRVAEEASKTASPFEIDEISEHGYFEMLQKHKEVLANCFVREYIGLLSFYFSAVSALRHKAYGDLLKPPRKIKGETIGKDEMNSEEAIFRALKRKVRSGGLEEAVKAYKEKRSISTLERVLDEDIFNFIKDESRRDMFSVASIYLYLESMRQNVATVRAILSAAESGIKEAELRGLVRNIRRGVRI
ncbi:MAG: V-type ATPase subunit [bacterium]|nr:V-type ATPase subunit [bacterium]